MYYIIKAKFTYPKIIKVKRQNHSYPHSIKQNILIENLISLREFIINNKKVKHFRKLSKSWISSP